MTFITRIKKLERNSQESGASLMLAILVLAAITAIAFSLATIVFIEIRSAGNSIRTEPALYATFGVTEEALFQYKRFYTPLNEGDFNVTSCEGPKGADVCNIGGVELTLPGNQPLEFDNSPRVIVIPSREEKIIPLFVADSYEQQFVSITLEPFPNLGSASITASFIVTFEDGSTSTTVPVSVSPGNPYTFDQFLSDGQYELKLVNDNNRQDLTVKISTQRVGLAQPDGLPFVGEQVFRIVADYLGLTRTYQVRVPIP